MSKPLILMFLRVSLGWLLVIWGVNRIVNVEHGLAIAERFYFGFMAAEMLMPLLGMLQVVVGLLVVVGFWRRGVYPVQLLVNGASLLAVMASVVDPWAGCSRAPMRSSIRR